MTKRKNWLLLAAIAMLATSGQAYASGIDTNNPNLPPDGVYLTPTDVHAMYSGPGLAIVLSAIQHKPFANQTIRHSDAAGNETEDFPSTVNGQISINGSPNQPTNGSGPVTTEVFGKAGMTTGTFNTEMLQLNINGASPFGPYMIRESPTLASTGQTTITNIGGGMFHIDSFFDVFTELSIDSGQTWMPSQGPAHVVLQGVPEPASIVMLGLAMLGFSGLARRRR